MISGRILIYQKIFDADLKNMSEQY